jgi:hypothetical protein
MLQFETDKMWKRERSYVIPHKIYNVFLQYNGQFRIIRNCHLQDFALKNCNSRYLYDTRG